MVRNCINSICDEFKVDLARYGLEGVTILSHEVPTAGILYVDMALDFSQLSADELPYLPLFSRFSYSLVSAV